MNKKFKVLPISSTRECTTTHNACACVIEQLEKLLEKIKWLESVVAMYRGAVKKHEAENE